MIIHVTIKGQKIKLTRKEYLRLYAGNQQKNLYNDKILESRYNDTHTRNYTSTRFGLSHLKEGQEQGGTVYHQPCYK